MGTTRSRTSLESKNMLTALFLLGSLLVVTVPSAEGACCRCYHSDSRYCADDTPCTPYCGHGGCNIFGCNCGGGCRMSMATSEARNPLASFNSGASDPLDIFMAIDRDNSGSLDLGEIMRYKGEETQDMVPGGVGADFGRREFHRI